MSKAKRYNDTANALQQAELNKTAHKVRYGIKGVLLYLLPFPALIAAIFSLLQGDVINTLIIGGSFASYMVGATIARHGFKLEGEYNRRKIARAPTTPYKTVAAMIISITTGVLAWLGGADYSLIAAVVIGAVTLLGFALTYGLDPRKDKAGSISFGVTIEEVLDALDAAEIRLKAIDSAQKQIPDQHIKQRLNQITHKAREILTTIEDDPARLSSARKFLKVYLDGAQKVTEGYAKTYKTGSRTAALETDFNQVLNSIEQTFDEQHTKLLQNDNFDLDVQIEVLNQQLKREGVV